MVFSSLTFLCFALPLVIAVYYVAPRAMKNSWLLLFSLVFYSWGEPVYILLMLLSITVNWGAAMLIAHNPTRKRAAMAAVTVIDIGLLLVFKYSALLVTTLNSLTGVGLPVPHIPLPIGISFYTFQALSYVIDVYRGDTSAQPRIDKVALYISLFPQLIAGPIVRYVDVAQEIDERRETLQQFSKGMQRFLVGLAKKVLIANALAPLADEAFSLAGHGLSAPGAWLGIIAYALQIYYDFSGYSDMAIGLGHMFGFTFMENFNYPYISASIREFWTRWHISLSTWFRDYLYIPLGGNRRGRARHLANIAIVFLFTGLWHGASWTFLLWGAYHSFFRITESMFPTVRSPKWLRQCGTLLIVLAGWVLFRADTLSQCGQYIGSLIGIGGAAALTSFAPRSLVMLTAGVLGCSPWPLRLANRMTSPPSTCAKWVALSGLLLLCMASLASDAYNPFIYFRF